MGSQLVMTAKQGKTKTKKTARANALRRVFPYIVYSVAILALVFFGSINKFGGESINVDMRALAQNNFSASADQVSQMYIVSDLATSMNLSTASVITINYDSIISALSYASSTSADKIDKPTVIDTSYLAVGVVEYVVSNGEDIASIARKYSGSGVTETMIRWSNNFKATAKVKAGQKILVPSRAGFVYKVKKNDTVASLAKKYKSDANEIIAANSLELDSTLKVNMYILIPNGVLPETERPDYVAPTRKPTSYASYSSSYHAQYAAGNRYAYGWCTWYAWSRRPDLPSNMGNARSWGVNAARAGFRVDKTPRAGDIFQNNNGYYGHVGYVESVNSDGTITISDMNGKAGWGRVWTGPIAKATWSKWNFIHRK